MPAFGFSVGDFISAIGRCIGSSGRTDIITNLNEQSCVVK